MDRVTRQPGSRDPDQRSREPATAKIVEWSRAEPVRADRAGPWLLVLRRYVMFIAGANLIWEIAQLPLYTIWLEGTPGEIAFAVAHCTAGDILIASASLLGALLVIGNGRWPIERFGAVASLAFTAGLSYTIFSEWLNTEIRGSWAYTDVMPTLPLIGSGLSPLAQWIVIPLAAFWWARHPASSHPQPVESDS